MRFFNETAAWAALKGLGLGLGLIALFSAILLLSDLGHRRTASAAAPMAAGATGGPRIAAWVTRLRLLRSPGITLRDRRNCDDTVSRARRSPSAVKHDAEERPLVAAAEARRLAAGVRKVGRVEDKK